ncbi:MAG: iron-containing alcohol dehydrogenase [Ruminococcaceae bacterium]|nr:iron-containing alcohol dehydrogenase [Oscillospiraceae bacterium]
MIFNTFMPVRVISGTGCVKEFDYSSFGKKCLIMTGRTAAQKSGLLDDLIAALEKMSVEYITFSEVEQNPHVNTCHYAGELAREFEADFIIGAGGGSAMDAAKAAAVYTKNPDFEPNDIFTKKVTSALPFILIGTTAGTGSEVTKVSVLSFDFNGKPYKRSFKDDLTYATVALCDSTYTNTLNWEITSSSALDIICHAVESYFSKQADCLSKTYALKAIEIGWKAIVKAHWQNIVEKRQIEGACRQDLLTASIFGGLAINKTGTCFPHALSYALTSRQNIIHGKACAYFLPEFIRRMSKIDENGVKLIAEATGEASIDDFITGIESLSGARPTLSIDDCYEYTELSKDSASIRNALVNLEEQEVFEIYKKLFTNKFN